MIYRSSENEIAFYRDAPGINQSVLKLLCKGVTYFNENLTDEEGDLYYEEKEHFIIGNAVDCKLTEGEEAFNSRYHVSSSTNKPSDTIMSIVKMAFDTYIGSIIADLDSWTKEERLVPNNINSSNLVQAIELAIASHNYQPKWGMEAKYNKIITDGASYWTELVESQGKQILSQEQSNLVNTIVYNFKNHPHTSRIFTCAEGSEDYDIIYQFPIFFNYNGVECKGLLDMVFVDHTKKIIAPVDIKTLFDLTINFPTTVRRRRYDFQASYYSEGLIQNINQLSNKLNKDLTNYKFNPFTFIIESTKKPGTPLVLVCSKELLSIGKYGMAKTVNYITVSGEKTYLETTMGFHDAIVLYKHHLQEGFDADLIVQQKNGVIEFDWFGIKSELINENSDW